MKPASASFTPYRLYLLAILVLVYACNFIDRMIISVIAQPLKTELGLSDFKIGILGGVAFAFFYSVLTIPIARFAERRSRLRIISLATAAWSLFTALGGLAQSFVQLLMTRLAVGVGEAGFLAPAQSLVADEFPPRRRATALAILSLGPPLGAILGGVLGGHIATEYGWRTALIGVGVPGLLLSVLAWATLREPVRGAMDEASPASDPAPKLRDVALNIWRTPTLLCILLAGICSNFVGYGLFPFLPSFLTRGFGLSVAEAGTALGLTMGIGGGLGLLIGALTSDWLGRANPRLVLLVPAMSFALSTPAPILAFSQSSLQGTIVMLGLSEVLRFIWLGPAFGTIHNVVVPRARASTVAIVYFFMTLIGMGLGPVFAGALSDLFATLRHGPGYAIECSPDAVLSLSCSAASLEGLRQALMTTSIGFVLGSIPLAVASFAQPRDWWCQRDGTVGREAVSGGMSRACRTRSGISIPHPR